MVVVARVLAIVTVPVAEVTEILEPAVKDCTPRLVRVGVPVAELTPR